MSINLEDAIKEKIHALPDEQRKEVLEFIEGLERKASGEEPARPSSGNTMDGEKKQIDLREHGISREEAADLRARLSTFEDWNDPAMDIYDDYDTAKAALDHQP